MSSRITFLLAVLALAISSTAHADGFYVESGLAVLDHPSRLEPRVFDADLYQLRQSPNGQSYFTPVVLMVDSYRAHDINEVSNPYGTLAFGYDYRWRAFLFDLQALHQSSIATGKDRGQNSLRFSIRWYPFGGVR